MIDLGCKTTHRAAHSPTVAVLLNYLDVKILDIKIGMMGMPNRPERKEQARRNDLVDTLVAEWAQERPDLDATPMEVVGRILHLGRILEARADTALKVVGLNYTDLDVLATIRRSGAPYKLTPTVLSRSVLITSGAMTASLDRLERAALIKRSLSPSDRRSILAELTPSGRDLIDKAILIRFDEAREALISLSPSHRRQLAGLLRSLTLSIS